VFKELGITRQKPLLLKLGRLADLIFQFQMILNVSVNVRNVIGKVHPAPKKCRLHGQRPHEELLLLGKNKRRLRMLQIIGQKPLSNSRPQPIEKRVPGVQPRQPKPFDKIQHG